jgi:hypothetical protein
MTNYYLDIETDGEKGTKPDFNKDSIITIQYQKLDRIGQPIEDLVILKSWESSEEQIIKDFYKIFITDKPFDFIPIGFNLIFDFSFLYQKFNKYNLPLKYDFMQFLFSEKPHIDIKYSFIIANNLEFKGSSLNNMSKKNQDGSYVSEWLKQKNYSAIEVYIKQEAESFLKVLSILKEDLIKSKDSWKQ